jgi:hypothetical protein
MPLDSASSVSRFHLDAASRARTMWYDELPTTATQEDPHRFPETGLGV